MDIQRYKYPLAVVGIVVVVLLVVYLAWIGPEGSKFSTLNTQKATLISQEQSLSAVIDHLRVEGGHLKANCANLNKRIAEIPTSPDQGEFLTQIDGLASSTGTATPSYTFSLAVPSSGSSSPSSSSTSSLPAITVTLNFTGGYRQVIAFLNGLDNLGRLYTVSSYSLKEAASTYSSGSSAIIPSGVISYSVTLVGNIYYNPKQNDVCATSRTS